MAYLDLCCRIFIHRFRPTFRRCVVSPHFRLTFRRCAKAPPPLEPPVAAFPPPPHHAHLPKESHFPAFSSHLPKVRKGTIALEPPVAAFPPPPYHAHLPKVSHFPAFSSHLPKVRKGTTATRTACSRVFPSTVPCPPSEGASFPRIFVSPSEGGRGDGMNFYVLKQERN